ncbi:MAG TPA: hypothetical protein VI756_32715 [Blastocatellia bacterium]
MDHAGVVWFGTGSGIYSYDEARDRWEDHSQAFGKKLWGIGAMAEDGRGRIWAEYTLTDEIAFYANGRWQHPDAICQSWARSPVRALIPGRDGRVWFVSSAGLLQYDGVHWEGPFNPTQQALSQYGLLSTAGRANQSPSKAESGSQADRSAKGPSEWLSGFWTGTEDRDGEVWLSGERAIWRFDGRTGDWKAYPAIYPQNEGPFEVAEDNDRGIWFWDTRGHLSRYDKDAGSLGSHDISVRLTEIFVQVASVESLWSDRPGRMIIGTSQGNFIFDISSGELNPLTIQETPKQWARRNDISAVASDRHGRIWMACDDQILVLRQ